MHAPEVFTAHAEELLGLPPAAQAYESIKGAQHSRHGDI